MKKDEKKQYQKPEIIEHENLSDVTKGSIRQSNPEIN